MLCYSCWPIKKDDSAHGLGDDAFAPMIRMQNEADFVVHVIACVADKPSVHFDLEVGFSAVPFVKAPLKASLRHCAALMGARLTSTAWREDLNRSQTYRLNRPPVGRARSVVR